MTNAPVLDIEEMEGKYNLTAALAALAEPLTLKAFVRLYNTEGRFEYVDGARIPLMAILFDHSLAISNLTYGLNIQSDRAQSRDGFCPSNVCEDLR